MNANATTGSDGRQSYSLNGGDGFRVGEVGHAGDAGNFANIVKFNFSEAANAGELSQRGGRGQNLILLLNDVGLPVADAPKINIELLKMGEVTYSDSFTPRCTKPRFIGAKFTFDGVTATAVVGKGISFYLYGGKTYRSASACKRAIKAR